MSARAPATPPRCARALPAMMALASWCAALAPRAIWAAPPPASAPAPPPASAPAPPPASAPAPPPASAPAPPAGAQAPAGADTDVARAAYDAAKVLYEDGDYAGALLGFQRSYELSGDLRSLWNMAICEKGLRRYARAIKLLERYLTEGGERLTDEDRAGAQYLITTMRAFVSTVVLTANERGAAVFIDEEQVGVTPLARPLLVDVGFRRVRVSKKGFVSFDERRRIMGATEVAISVRLAPEVHEGRLVVVAGKRDLIWLDGKLLGEGRFDGAVPSGGHTLRVSAPGMKPYQADVSIEDDRVRRVQVTLEREAPALGLPAWLLVGGGAVLAAGIGVGAGYLLFKAGEDPAPVRGNLGPYVIEVP
ncbi:PEGA domain-containing protein [Sorangium sp. So ce134]